MKKLGQWDNETEEVTQEVSETVKQRRQLDSAGQ
jgi:hypothetical protein